jgi:ataxin-10
VLGRCVVQLLHNICSVAPELHSKVLTAMEKPLLDCLLVPDEKLRNFSASVLLRLIENEKNTLGPAVVQPLLHALRNDSEFALLCIKTLMKERPSLVSMAYDGLDAEDRLLLLDAVAELKGDEKVPKALADKLVSAFKLQADVLFRGQETDSSDLTKLAGLLSEMALGDESLPQDKSILISAVHLLKMAHESQKSLAAPNSQDQQQSQAVEGFKRSLVRLIGNLCWRNKTNQDTVLLSFNEGCELNDEEFFFQRFASWMEFLSFLIAPRLTNRIRSSRSGLSWLFAVSARATNRIRTSFEASTKPEDF